MIDIHAHLLPQDLPNFAAKYDTPDWPSLATDDAKVAIYLRGELYRAVDERYWSIERRLDYLDLHGIDRQVISPLPVLMPTSGKSRGASDVTRWLNSSIAAYVQARADRFQGFGTVAFDGCATIEAGLEDVVQLGLRGVEFPTVFAGAELDAQLCQDFFVECARRGLPVLLHPTARGVIPRVTGEPLRAALGITTDSATAAFALLMADIFDRAPDLRLCLSHGGGTLFWVLPRLCRIVGPERGERLRRAARKLWVDSASLDPEQVRYLGNFVDPDRILLGSDFPAATSDPRSSFASDTSGRSADVEPALAFLEGKAR